MTEVLRTQSSQRMLIDLHPLLQLSKDWDPGGLVDLHRQR
jgi:hypothetical protein